MSRENLSSGLPTSSNTNKPVQPYKMTGGLKFQIEEVDGFYFLCSENKVAVRLCIWFLHMQKQGGSK